MLVCYDNEEVSIKEMYLQYFSCYVFSLSNQMNKQARRQLNWIGDTDVEVKLKAGKRLKVQHLCQKERSICQSSVCT